MEVIHINSIADIKDYGPLAVAHGFFDGVHFGHQILINQANYYAKKYNWKSAVVTFNKKYVEGKNAEEFISKLRLSTLERKIEILDYLGVDIMIVLNFEVFCNFSAKEYIDKVIVALGTKHFIMGKDNKFGYKARGNVDNILELSNDRFSVGIAGQALNEEGKISTSKLKEMIKTTNISEVNDSLMYYYKLNGEVVHGNQIGRNIGFPTANLLITDEMLIPRVGVYATIVKINGKLYNSMTNIGYNPTVDFRKRLNVETNIFDFNEDIYGMSIDIYFIKMIREEQKFANVNQLVEQLKSDVESVSKIHKAIETNWII